MIARLRIAWRDSDRLDRLQVAGAAGLVLLVFGVFAVGAMTRTQPRSPLTVADRSAAPERSPASQRRERERKRDGGGGSRAPLGAPGAVSGPAAGAPAAGIPGRSPAPDRTPRPKEPKPAAPTPAAPAAGSQTTPLVIGVAHRSASATAALGAALGLGQLPGDAARQARVVADWVNAGGGVGGRPIELRLAPFDPTASVSFSSAFAGACEAVAAGAQRPVAVVAALDDPPAQAGCLAPRGIPLVGDGPAPGDRKLFEDTGAHLIAPGSMAIDRLAAAQVRLLLADGWLAKGARAGIVRLDGAPFERAVRDTVRPALERAGVTVAGEEVLPAPRTAVDAAGLLARSAAAVGRLRVGRVERLFVFDAGLVTPALMREAERQAFRPRWALNSTMVPAGLPGQVPAAQLAGAAGAGVAPLLDLTGDGPAVPPSRARCEEIYRAAGVPVGSGAGRYAAIALCDSIIAVRDAVTRAKGTSPAQLAEAFEGFAEARPSAVALATRYGAGRHDGAAAVRRLRFEDGCSCIRYTGDAEAAG